MTILLTGGAGFIGHTLTHQLLNQGHSVLLVDNFNHSYDPAVKWRHIESLRPRLHWQLYQGDIRDPAFLLAIFQQYTVDVVVHLAGLAGVRASLADPHAYFDHNLTGTAVLLDAMRSTGVKRLVFASSSSVYGVGAGGAFRETDPADESVSPYAQSKRAAEQLCYDHHQQHGLAVFCLRLFTVYGPQQRPDMAISRFIRQLHTGQPISLFGNGESRRDYTYVDDVVSGIEQAIERVLGYEIINLGSARPVRLRELVSLLEHLTGRRVPIQWLAVQPGDVPYTHAAIDKARRLLNYQPATDLAEGLRRMVVCYRQLNADAVYETGG